MKKVKLTESQIERLVGGVINEDENVIKESTQSRLERIADEIERLRKEYKGIADEYTGEGWLKEVDGLTEKFSKLHDSLVKAQKSYHEVKKTKKAMAAKKEEESINRLKNRHENIQRRDQARQEGKKYSY